MTFPLAAATLKSDDGVTLYYETHGKGVPILLLSGGPGFSSEYMLPVAQHLESRYKAVLLDQRGTGKSLLETYDATTLDHKKLVADIESLRRALKVDKLTLVGHSWGGILSMMYAAAHPDRVRALVLIDSGGPTIAGVAKFTANHTSRMTEEDTKRVAEGYANLQKDHKAAILEITRARTPPYFHDRAKALRFADALNQDSFNDKMFWPVVGQLNASFDLRPGLKNVNVPVLIIHGKSDPLESAQEVHDALAGSRVEMIDDAGHFPWAEQPAAVYRVLDAFLRQVIKR
jgi:proline iminopeptidase